MTPSRTRRAGRRRRGAPRGLVVRGEWPDGETPAGDVGCAYAQEVARRLRQAIGDQSLREIERKTSISAMTLATVLQGRSFPTLDTLARIEEGLGQPIIPDYFERRKLLARGA